MFVCVGISCFFFSILLLCFMPLLRTCCMRALERDGYLATWSLLSLIMRAVFSHVHVRVACFSVYYPTQFVACLLLWAQQQQQEQEQQQLLIITRSVCNKKLFSLFCGGCAAFVCFLEFSF